MTVQQLSNSDHGALSGCGERLRQAREAAGLTIDDVAARLHMPARVVESLEAEDWSRLGAPVFVRGQVRSYSRLLGLTTAPMMASLNVEPVRPAELVSYAHVSKFQWWSEQIGRRLVYIILTLSLAIPVWVATRQHLQAPGAVVATLDAPVSETAADAPKEPQTLVASMTPMVPTTSATPAVGKTSLQPVAGQVVLHTTGESWVKVTGRDGATLEQVLLPAGSERQYPLAQIGRLTIGNVAAVKLASDGHAVDLAAVARANVAHFTVSSDGSLVAAD